MFDSDEGRRLASEYARWMLTRQAQQGNPGYREEQGTDAKLMAFNEKTRPLWNKCHAICQRAFPYRNSDVIPEG